MSIFAMIASLATGVMLGLFGSGGSIITLPALIYLVGVETKPAIAMSLGIVAVTAAISSVTHWRRGNVNAGVAAVFALFGAIGTYGGARIGVMTPAEVQLGLFAVIMYAAAWRMLQPAAIATPASGMIQGDGTLALGSGWSHLGPIVLHGLVVGVLTGMVGVGGGFLIVPALVLLSGLPMKQAVGTSLVIVTAKSVAGFVGYVGSVAIDWDIMALFTAIAVGGSFAGTLAAKHMSAEAMKRGFAVFLVLVATYIVIKELL